ncbi:LmbU family transcriptional regulator [Streptomyces sp. NPDC048566]|uniref:LmbU family transcriptional regulator n=1 Tax=Streptomyces sp. NPDC048566 TaxID=3365569 RepID=UPI00371B69C9
MTGAVSTASRHKTRPHAAGEPSRCDGVLSFVGAHATVQKSGMVFPQNLSERSWEQIGTNLREFVNSSAWWLADWLIYGETTYGWRRYKEAVERTGLDYQTLRNYAWVARRFEQHRRRDGLSFAHHAEVTRLSPPEQDYWLRKAEQQKWSRNELRRAVRASLAVQNDEAELPAAGGEKKDAAPAGGPADAGKTGVTRLTIELPAHRLEDLSKAAAAHGLSVDKWVARMLEADERQSA